MKKRLPQRLLSLLLALVMTFTCCPLSFAAQDEATPVTISIRTPETTVLQVGQGLQLIAEVNPEGIPSWFSTA